MMLTIFLYTVSHLFIFFGKMSIQIFYLFYDWVVCLMQIALNLPWSDLTVFLLYYAAKMVYIQ